MDGEDAQMANVSALKTCVVNANGDDEKVKLCRAEFRKQGGTSEGGKVFSDEAGGKVFVTTNGGKVFDLKA
jgi:hypothetical protein